MGVGEAPDYLFDQFVSSEGEQSEILDQKGPSLNGNEGLLPLLILIFALYIRNET